MNQVFFLTLIHRKKVMKEMRPEKVIEGEDFTCLFVPSPFFFFFLLKVAEGRRMSSLSLG